MKNLIYLATCFAVLYGNPALGSFIDKARDKKEAYKILQVEIARLGRESEKLWVSSNKSSKRSLSLTTRYTELMNENSRDAKQRAVGFLIEASNLSKKSALDSYNRNRLNIRRKKIMNLANGIEKMSLQEIKDKAHQLGFSKIQQASSTKVFEDKEINKQLKKAEARLTSQAIGRSLSSPDYIENTPRRVRQGGSGSVH